MQAGRTRRNPLGLPTSALLNPVLSELNSLSDNVVDIWVVRIDGTASIASQLLQVLSADEKDRAFRFRSEYHRNTFVVTHGLLRLLLSVYVSVPPDVIEFGYINNGKPQLTCRNLNCMRPNSVQFNMSHSDILALYAFTLDSEVGVDLEKIQAVPDAEQIAKHYFSSEECADFVSVAEEQRLEAFLRCWTRKEAYLKAVGHGLSVPLKSFRVSLRAEATPELLSVNGYSKPARKWILCDLPLSSDHIGTLAMSAPDRFILMREFGSPGEALDALKLCSRTL